MADFQIFFVSRIFGVFTSGFFQKNNSIVLVKWVFACF